MLLFLLTNTFLLQFRRSTEISLVIRQTMEACIMTHLMPRSQVPFSASFSTISQLVLLLVQFVSQVLLIVCYLQIDIFVQVLQADGGTMNSNFRVPMHVMLMSLFCLHISISRLKALKRCLVGASSFHFFGLRSRGCKGIILQNHP